MHMFRILILFVVTSIFQGCLSDSNIKKNEISKAPMLRCDPNEPWTDNNIAIWLNVTPERIYKVKRARSLNNKDLCTMPEDKLQRAFFQLDHPKVPILPNSEKTLRIEQ